MSVSTASKRVEAAETEIAVLQVRFQVLEDKMDDIKVEVKDLHDCLDRNMEETKAILNSFQAANREAHDELAEKISSMEKVKWMLMGAAAVLGATGIEAIQMLFGA